MKRSQRSPEKYERRRTQIIDRAAEVFAASGYHATTIDDLTEATKLQRGGLYHYIGGKKDLLLSIHERFIDPLLTASREITAENDRADVTLRKLAHVLMETIDAYHDQVTVFLHEWRVIADEPEWEAIRASRRAFELEIESVLRRGVEEGVFQIVDVRLTVLAFLGMINYSYQWFTPDGRSTADDIADAFADIFLLGIARGAAARESHSFDQHQTV
jgi:AcrR family transcriptional regulator